MEWLTRVFFSSQRGLHGAAFALTAATLVSQVLALVRDRLLAGSFGAGGTLDVYYAAFRIPDLLFVSAASLFSATVVIPFLAERIEEGGDAHARLFSSLMRAFFALMALTLAAAYAGMPWLAPLAAPGFSAAQHEMLILFARILLLSPLLLGLSGIVAGATQTYRHFVLFSLTPVVYNLGIIGGIVFLLPRFGLSGVVWGVVVGAALHLVIQLPVCARHGLLMRGGTDYAAVFRVIRASLPRTFTLALTQIELTVLTALASLFAAGSVAALQFGYNLQSIPLSLVGVSYAVAVFPALATLWARGERGAFSGEVRRAEGHVVVWSLLAAALFILLREHIVSVVLRTGAFGDADVAVVAGAMAFFVVSLASQGLVLLYTRAFYAARHTALPLFAHAVGAALALLGAFMLLRVPSASALPGPMLLAGAFSGGSVAAMLVLMYLFRRYIGQLSSRALWVHSAVAVLLLWAAVRVLLPFYIALIGTHTPLREFAAAAAAGLDGLAVAVVYLYWVGVAPAREFAAAAATRLRARVPH